jgi:hypothetical protein
MAADPQVFLGVDEEGQLFDRRFVERHGGAFVAIAEPDGCFRLDFPPGTHIMPNEESGAPLQESYHIVYPDGTRMTWYRVLKLDRRWTMPWTHQTDQTADCKDSGTGRV